MKKIGLTVYGLSVQNKENQRLELHNIYGKTLIDIIKDFANENINEFSIDDKNEKVFSYEQIHTKELSNKTGQKSFKALYGRVKTGEYGIESELVDVNSGDTYNRSVHQADTMPFGFCIAVPEGEIDNAIIVFQTVSIYGIKTIFERKLIECMKKIDNNLNVNVGVIVPMTYIDRIFEKGILKAIRMIRYEIPEDVSEGIGINYGVKQTIEERIIKRPVGFMEKKARELNEWKRGQRSYTDVVEIKDFQYNDLKLDFKMGGSTKRISLKNIDNVVVTEDITNLVEQHGGHPLFEDLKNVMIDTAREYLVGKGLIADEEVS